MFKIETATSFDALRSQLADTDLATLSAPSIMSDRRRYLFYGLAVLAITVIVGIERFGLSDILFREPISADKQPAKRGKDSSQENKTADESCNNQSCAWEKQQLFRKGLVWDICRTFHAEAGTYEYPPLLYRLYNGEDRKPEKASMLNHFLVIDSLKLIYCFIPKVGCTSWKRLFLVMEGPHSSMVDIGQRESHILASNTFSYLSSYPIEKAERLLATYRKFVFVRNPFERVLSAYQDKFQEDYPASRIFRQIWSERIIRSTGGSPTRVQHLLEIQRRKDGTLNVTFPQFARFLSAIDGPKTRRYMNEHWTQMYGICHPCLIDYDWIGNYDSLRTDADSILTAAGADPNVRFPNFTTNPTGSSNGDTLLRYYSTLTTSEIESLYKHFELDFSLFGFDIPPSIRGLLDSRERGDKRPTADPGKLSHSNTFGQFL